MRDRKPEIGLEALRGLAHCQPPLFLSATSQVYGAMETNRREVEIAGFRSWLPVVEMRLGRGFERQQQPFAIEGSL
jgi:hypothetical protein